MEAPLKDSQITNLQEQVKSLEAETANCDSTTAECVKLKDLAEKEAQLYRESYEREKTLTDRTMALVDEANKTRWGQLFTVGGMGLLIGIILVFLL